VFQRRQGRARREHPAAEQIRARLARLGVADFEEGRAFRRLDRRPFIANARGNAKRPEFGRLADPDLDRRHPRRDLVETLEHGDRIGIRLGRCRRRQCAGKQK